MKKLDKLLEENVEDLLNERVKQNIKRSKELNILAKKVLKEIKENGELSEETKALIIFSCK